MIETKEADILWVEIAAVVVGVSSIQEQIIVDDSQRVERTRAWETRRRIELDFLPDKIIYQMSKPCRRSRIRAHLN